jgi:beta-galactosidase
LAKEQIWFSVEGEGNIIGDALIGANPRNVEFGSAPVLIRSTVTPGKIKVQARVLFEGENVATPVSIELESIAPKQKPVYSEKPQNRFRATAIDSYKRQLSDEEKQKILNEVELQQTEFGEKAGKEKE